MDISLLRGLQLVLDQSPAGAGFKKSHRVEELVAEADSRESPVKAKYRGPNYGSYLSCVSGGL